MMKAIAYPPIPSQDPGSFYAQLHRIVFQQVLLIIRCPQTSADITQDVVLKCWARKDQLAAMENWKGYLLTMTRNQTFTYLQKKKTQQELAAQLRCVQTDTSWPDYAEAAEMQQVIREAVNLLSARQRLVYTLRREKGFRRHEIAQQLNISPDTVKGTLQKALKSISLYVQRRYEGHFTHPNIG